MIAEIEDAIQTAQDELDAIRDNENITEEQIEAVENGIEEMREFINLIEDCICADPLTGSPTTSPTGDGEEPQIWSPISDEPKRRRKLQSQGQLRCGDNGMFSFPLVCKCS